MQFSRTLTLFPWVLRRDHTTNCRTCKCADHHLDNGSRPAQGLWSAPDYDTEGTVAHKPRCAIVWAVDCAKLAKPNHRKRWLRPTPLLPLGRSGRAKWTTVRKSSGPRTQFLQRLGAFGDGIGQPRHRWYSPPSHSKENPSERGWGILARHWHGTKLVPGEAAAAPLAAVALGAPESGRSDSTHGVRRV